MTYAYLLMLTIWTGFDELSVLRSGKPMYEHFCSYHFDLCQILTMRFFSPKKNSTRVLDPNSKEYGLPKTNAIVI